MEQLSNNDLLDKMAVEKHQILNEAQKSDFSGGLLRTGVGAAGGMILGTTTVLTGALVGIVNAAKTLLTKNPELIEKIERTVDKLERSPHLSKQAEQELVKIGEEVLEHTGGISKHMIKHPKGWVAGFTAAGAGMGLLWQSRVKSKKVHDAQKEVSDVEQLQKSWISRTHESGQSSSQER